MIQAWKGRYSSMVLVAVLALALAGTAVLAACGSKAPDTTAKGPTAKGGLAVARAALSTTAPDAKLLVVQTASAVTATATPVWGYLFGSPKDDKTYVVYVENGKATPAQPYGDAGLSATEWSAVPNTDAWKIDSDEAYKKAFAAAGGKGAPAAWAMGLVTYVPKAAATSTVQPFVWSVMFEPGASGIGTAPVEVDAKTGTAKVVK